jgi:hypothetical protein
MEACGEESDDGLVPALGVLNPGSLTQRSDWSTRHQPGSDWSDPGSPTPTQRSDWAGGLSTHLRLVVTSSTGLSYVQVLLVGAVIGCHLINEAGSPTQ